MQTGLQATSTLLAALEAPQTTQNFQNHLELESRWKEQADGQGHEQEAGNSAERLGTPAFSKDQQAMGREIQGRQPVATAHRQGDGQLMEDTRTDEDRHDAR